MLKSLTLENFRGFSEHKIEFGPETILIGQNNAGKTTVIEALRVLSVCQNRIPTALFIPCPPWLDGICTGPGFRVSLETINFDFTNVHHSYNSDKPAIIKAKNKNHSQVHVFIGNSSDQVFCQIRPSGNKISHSRTEYPAKLFGKIKVMPPVGSLLPNERAIAKERLSRFRDGYLAYRHFRNQLWESPGEYRTFKDLLEKTWSGLTIQHFESDHGEGLNEFSLLIREGRFTSEVSWHGHGLQAWMQTIWFLSRVDSKSTIVLDEPDVYLHADLQRKLIKVIEGMSFEQSIIATHSSEIIGDVPFQSVTIVQKKEKFSGPSKNASAIQAALREMGSLHSIQLAKVAQAGVILFVEGGDKSYLTDVSYKLGGQYFDLFSKIAVQEIGGKGNWKHAVGAAKALKVASDGQIAAALLLDRDYMLDEQVEKICNESEAEGLILKIWDRKEIENYFINAEVMRRFVSKRSEGDVDISEIYACISKIEQDMMEDLILSYANVIQHDSNPKIEAKTAYKRAKFLVEEKIKNNNSIHSMVGGKDFLSKISTEVQNKYGVGFNALSLCKEASIEEIPEELSYFVKSLCETRRI